jgi:hypothetical protein
VTCVKVGDKVTSMFLPAWIAGRWDPGHLGVALGTTVDGVLADYAMLDADAVLVASPRGGHAMTVKLTSLSSDCSAGCPRPGRRHHQGQPRTRWPVTWA